MPKIIKDKPTSSAGLVIGNNAIRMMGKKDNYVMADERGTTINGPMSFVNGAEHIRVGGLWTFNSTMMLSIPSTMATPSAVFKVDPPIKQFQSLMEDVTVMVGLMGMLSGI